MSEQRKHLRLPVESRTFIELVSPQLGEGGKLTACRTLNISRRGLQVVLADTLTVGAILQISIELPNDSEPLYLAGEVRWCRYSPQDPDNPWHAGFKLLNAGSSDIGRWAELVARLER